MESSSNKPKWPLYLTNWGLTVCTIQAFLSGLMLVCAILGTNLLDNSDLTNAALKAYKSYWITNSIATTVAFTISFVYWTLIHQRRSSGNCKCLKWTFWCFQLSIGASWISWFTAWTRFWCLSTFVLLLILFDCYILFIPLVLPLFMWQWLLYFMPAEEQLSKNH